MIGLSKNKFITVLDKVEIEQENREETWATTDNMGSRNTLIILLSLVPYIVSEPSCQTSEMVKFSPCPYWPEKILYEEHSVPITLRCYVEPKNASITWWRNGHQIVTDNHILIRFKGKELYIKNPELQDTGNYSCVAMVNNSSISYWGYFRVTERSTITRPRITHTSPLNLKQRVILGTNTSISCTFDVGNSSDVLSPAMTMNWKRNGTVLEDNYKSNYYHHRTKDGQQTFLLEIRNITEEDYGPYECFGENGYGSTSQNITLLKTVDPTNRHSEDFPLWKIIAISCGVGFVVVALLVSMVIFICRRKPGDKLDWEDPNLDHYEVPEHVIEYDVFISYSSEDENWVRETLFGNLIENGYNVNIDFKDFVPGMAIAENIVDSIYKSRKTVVVMSKNFLKSMWGQFELQQAHNRAISQRKDVLILIKYGSCKVPAKLMGKTFLDFTDKAIEPHFWKRFYDSVGKPGEGLQKKMVEDGKKADHQANKINENENCGDYNHIIINLKNEKNKIEGTIDEVNIRQISCDHSQRLASTESCESQDSCIGRRISVEEQKPLLV